MATQHLYVVIQGDYTAAALATEVWQVGIRCRVSNTGAADFGDLPTDVDWGDAALVRDEAQTYAESNYAGALPATSTFNPVNYLTEQVAPAVDAWIGAANMFPSTTRVVRAIAYGMEDGKVATTGTGPAKATLTWKATYNPNGAGSAQCLPPQCSPVASFVTAVAGRKGKGRIYMPATPQTLLSVDGGLYSSGACTNLATAAVALVGGIAYDPGVADDLYIDPIVTGVPWTKYAKVKAVRVGNVVDTQRRRRAQLQETYQSVDL